jgi:hypothetical protein
MPRFSFSFLLLIAYLLPACSAVTTTAIPTPSADREKTEEQAVYAAALKSLYGASFYVIRDTTETGTGATDNTSTTLDYVLQNIHDVDQDTVDNFISRNDPASVLLPGMEIDAEYNLLSDYTYSQIFNQNQSGWEIFYNHYPNAPGLTSLSRVGFNKNFDQALIYAGTQSYWLAGAGYYLLMKKVDGAWIMDQQVMVWIS